MAYTSPKATMEELAAAESDAFAQRRYRVKLQVLRTDPDGSDELIAWVSGWKADQEDAVQEARDALAFDPADLDLEAMGLQGPPEGTKAAAGFPDSQLTNLSAALDAL